MLGMLAVAIFLPDVCGLEYVVVCSGRSHVSAYGVYVDNCLIYTQEEKMTLGYLPSRDSVQGCSPNAGALCKSNGDRLPNAGVEGSTFSAAAAGTASR